MTQFQYDNGGPLTKGNLTKITEAVGTAIQQDTLFEYSAPDGTFGLPTAAVNPVGGRSTFDYDDTSGFLTSAASPTNDVLLTTHPDYPASVTILHYNTENLPDIVTDPLGHQVQVSYNAEAVNSPNLVITLTFPADSSTRKITLDGAGRIIKAQDERGVVTQWVYNPQGQVKTITRAVGTVDQATTTFFYDSRGDLQSFDPPLGSASRVSYDYQRYDRNGNLVSPAIYEGEVTKIRYPNGSMEFFGYNEAGELIWWRKPDRTVVTVERDALHRPWRVTYPLTNGGSSFSVTTTFDGLGRPDSTTDAVGLTTVTYDELNRLKSYTPPAPQKALTYTYTRDSATNHRWITTVAVTGVGSYTYQEDSKGRLYRLLNPFSQVTRLEYDKDGKNTLVAYNNGLREERQYTTRDWLSTLTIKQANGTILDQFTSLYTDGNGVYDPTGHLRREVDLGGRTHAFFYNNLYRLVQETHPDFTSLGYTYDKNGNRTQRNANGVVDYYGYDTHNKLLWVNRGSSVAPTSGQTAPYTTFLWSLNGEATYRERRYESGALRSQYLRYDGAGNLRLLIENNLTQWSAQYNGAGLRVQKSDTWEGGSHDYSWGPGGVLFDSFGSTTYTPG
ncbi:MAG: hypothetical protein C4321_01725, partial [Chloroflexota bacterium]